MTPLTLLVRIELLSVTALLSLARSTALVDMLLIKGVLVRLVRARLHGSALYVPPMPDRIMLAIWQPSLLTIHLRIQETLTVMPFRYVVIMLELVLMPRLVNLLRSVVEVAMVLIVVTLVVFVTTTCPTLNFLRAESI